MSDWKQEKYREVFDGLCRQVARRREGDPCFTIKDLRAQLDAQYIYQGHDWDGRGELHHITVSATIAAYEHLLAEWEKELGAAKRGFALDGRKYEQASRHQKEWGREAIDGLGLRGDERILDLGCGDGVLSADLASRVPRGSVLGIDASEGMIAAARERAASNLAFRLEDIGAIDYRDEFDLAFSNAALHWVKDHRNLLARVHRALKPGGRLRFEFAGDGNCIHFFHVVREVMGRPDFVPRFADFEWPWYMPAVDEYETLLAAHPFVDVRVWPQNRDRYFADADEMIRWIDQPSLVPFLASIAEDARAAFRNAVVERMIEASRQSDGTCFETFKRINVAAVKPVADA